MLPTYNMFMYIYTSTDLQPCLNVILKSLTIGLASLADRVWWKNIIATVGASPALLTDLCAGPYLPTEDTLPVDHSFGGLSGHQASLTLDRICPRVSTETTNFNVGSGL